MGCATTDYFCNGQSTAAGMAEQRVGGHRSPTSRSSRPCPRAATGHASEGALGQHQTSTSGQADEIYQAELSLRSLIYFFLRIRLLSKRKHSGNVKLKCFNDFSIFTNF